MECIVDNAGPKVAIRAIFESPDRLVLLAQTFDVLFGCIVIFGNFARRREGRMREHEFRVDPGSTSGERGDQDDHEVRFEDDQSVWRSQVDKHGREEDGRGETMHLYRTNRDKEAGKRSISQSSIDRLPSRSVHG